MDKPRDELDEFSFDPATHIYKLNGLVIPGVNEIIREAGLSFIDYVRSNVLEAARQFGTAVHKACELDDKNDLAEDILSKPLLPYLNGWRNFRKQFQLEIWEIEKSIYSKKWQFAGTPDRIGVYRSKDYKAPAVVEIKTDREYTPATTLQTAAYFLMWNERHPDRKLHDVITVILNPKKKIGYEITISGKLHIEVDKEVFIACVQLYHWKKRLGLIK